LTAQSRHSVDYLPDWFSCQRCFVGVLEAISSEQVVEINSALPHGGCSFFSFLFKAGPSRFHRNGSSDKINNFIDISAFWRFAKPDERAL
jgi:hypothetical protein